MKNDSLAAGEMTDFTYNFRTEMQKYKVNVPWRFDRYTTNGALGDARRSSLEYGKAVIDSAVSNFVAFMDNVVKETPTTG